MPSPKSIDNSREVLKVMIFQEGKHYTCTDYRSLDSVNSYEETHLDSLDSSLEVVREIANLVTDVRTENQPKSERRNNCVSPGTTVCDIYEKSNIRCHQNLQLQGKIRNRWEVQYQPTQHKTVQGHSCPSSWRHDMLGWGYAVCETFDIENSILEVAFNILDRYIAVEISSVGRLGEPPLTREDVQLFAMVSIYIASKVFDRSRKLQLHELIEMAQGYYTENHIIDTEWAILEALKWHVNPPTVMDYCRIYMSLLPKGMARENSGDQEVTEAKRCEDMARIVLEDLFFTEKPNSVIALAIVLLITEISRGYDCNPHALQSFLRKIQGVVTIQKSEFDMILRRLECYYYC